MFMASVKFRSPDRLARGRQACVSAVRYTTHQSTRQQGTQRIAASEGRRLSYNSEEEAVESTAVYFISSSTAYPALASTGYDATTDSASNIVTDTPPIRNSNNGSTTL
jgi:hypothetical protein